MTMDGFNVGKILAGLRNPDLYLKKIKQDNAGQNELSFNSTFSQARPNSLQNILSPVFTNQLQMNQLASMDRSVYIRNLLGLPQNLGDILKLAQSNTPINSNTLMINNLNEDIIKSQKVLSQIFDESAELNLDKIQNQLSQQVQNAQAAQQKDAVALMFSGMINLSSLSELILKNSKHAVAGLIIAMASASKHGMSNEQITETLGIINSCVAMAESGSPAQTLKSLMLLYLPWLPLNEGVGFDLEVETDNGENESSDSKLTVLIQTKNFGNVKGVFTLTTSNSIDVYIICSDKFPKTLLQRSLMEEGTTHSMTTKIDVESVEPKNTEPAQNQQAKVNLSATNEMNPYLLLMAHAFIRNTIYLDTNAVIDDNESKDENS